MQLNMATSNCQESKHVNTRTRKHEMIKKYIYTKSNITNISDFQRKVQNINRYKNKSTPHIINSNIRPEALPESEKRKTGKQKTESDDEQRQRAGGREEEENREKNSEKTLTRKFNPANYRGSRQWHLKI